MAGMKAEPTTYRHTPEHDGWGPDGRCDAVVLEADGSLTRCGFAGAVRVFEPAADHPTEPVPPPAKSAGARVVAAVLMGILGIAIALDWLAFVLVVARGDSDPRLAVAFLFRVAVSLGYGAGVVWLWRRR